jgi:cyclophilin family peptidyl-prolyl cis-trans isomerase
MGMITAATSKKSAVGLAGLILVTTGCLCNHVRAVSNQGPALRAALMNPKHELWSERSPRVFLVSLETSKGQLMIEIHRDWAPRGVDRFFNLVRAGFFDNSRFFRVRPGFIAQFGIPGEPVVAAVWKDQAIPDDPVRQSNVRGTIAYAMTGPDTRTTQLYINLSDNSRLDKDGFAPIGRVVGGMDVADRIYSGYGEDAGGGMRGGKQGKIFESGNEYLDREFPSLDRLMSATIVKR